MQKSITYGFLIEESFMGNPAVNQQWVRLNADGPFTSEDEAIAGAIALAKSFTRKRDDETKRVLLGRFNLNSSTGTTAWIPYPIIITQATVVTLDDEVLVG